MVDLLTTKLFIPRARTNSVSRPRLVERLNSGLDKKLTLIAAPAGFGKTTLLSEWIPQSPRCVTWLSLDNGDNDPVKFWVYFISSLQRVHRDLGASVLTLLQSPQAPPINSILTALINEITAFPDMFAIVLDDYHLIESQPIHEALIFLIDHLPLNMHLVITTRIDPQLPLARLRARDKMNEFRGNDLRFMADEATVFLTQAMELDLSVEEVAALQTRTEGWIAGLQIAALSMQGHEDIPRFIQAFSGSHRHILGYLAEEVINQQPEDTLNFLLQTSILDRLSGQLCDAVTEKSGGQEILESLEHTNLFITPLDDEGKWYRYHHLFNEALQRRLRQVQPQQVPKLYRRASEWFEGYGLGAESIEYALRGEDWVRATTLIDDVKERAQLRGEVFTLLRWLDMLPDEAIRACPTLGLAHAFMLTLVDKFTAAEKRLAIVEQAFQASPVQDVNLQAALLGQAATVREANALMLEYPGEVIVAAGREALTLLPESDLSRRGYALNLIGCAQYLSLGDVQAAEQSFQEGLHLVRAGGDLFSELQILFHLSQMRAIQGRLRTAKEPCEELLHLASQPGWDNIPAAGLGSVMKGRILYEHNDLLNAQEALTAGIAGMEHFSLKRGEITGRILLARVKLALDEFGSARELIENAWEIIQKHHLKQIMIPAAAYRARLYLQMGDLEKAAQWAATIKLPDDSPLDPASEYDHMTLARVKLAQGRLEECQQILARLLSPAESAGRMARTIEILALQAVSASAQQDEDEALSALKHALVLAEPEGFVRSFVDEGEPMRLLLLEYQASLKQKIQDGSDGESLRILAYTDKLLAAFPQVKPVDKPNSNNKSLLDPLSERELEVLQLIASGHSNQEIADKLVVTVSTVKTHINRLYSKLGTQRRTQAIIIARERGLLSD